MNTFRCEFGESLHRNRQRGGISLDMDTFKPERIKLETVIDSSLGNEILNQNGMGELHVYEEVDLPKN